MKKAILLILWILMSLFLPACASTDGISKYDRLEAEVRTTEKAADRAKANLASFERQAEEAGHWFEYKSQCTSNDGIWYCPSGAAANNKRNEPTTTESLVRSYNQEKFAGCRCTTSSQMREMMRRIF